MPHADHGVGVDLPEPELHVLQHDVGSTGGDQIDRLAIILIRLDPASRKLAGDLVALDNEIAAIDRRHLGEAHLRALANEDLGTIVGVARPGAVEIEGNGGAGHGKRRAHKQRRKRGIPIAGISSVFPQ